MIFYNDNCVLASRIVTVSSRAVLHCKEFVVLVSCQTANFPSLRVPRQTRKPTAGPSIRPASFCFVILFARQKSCVQFGIFGASSASLEKMVPRRPRSKDIGEGPLFFHPSVRERAEIHGLDASPYLAHGGRRVLLLRPFTSSFYLVATPGPQTSRVFLHFLGPSARLETFYFVVVLPHVLLLRLFTCAPQILSTDRHFGGKSSLLGNFWFRESPETKILGKTHIPPLCAEKVGNPRPRRVPVLSAHGDRRVLLLRLFTSSFYFVLLLRPFTWSPRLDLKSRWFSCTFRSLNLPRNLLLRRFSCPASFYFVFLLARHKS